MGRKTTTEIYYSSDDGRDKNTERQSCRNTRGSGEGVRSLFFVGLPTSLKKKAHLKVNSDVKVL